MAVSLSVWILLYVADLLFFLWLLLWGGAEWIERRFIAISLLNIFAFYWDSEQIRLYALIMLVAATIWFVIGVFAPVVRIII